MSEAAGIVADVKGLAATGLRAVRTRLELLAIEVSEEKEWAVRFLAIAVTSLYLASFGLLLLAALSVLAVLFPPARVTNANPVESHSQSWATYA